MTRPFAARAATLVSFVFSLSRSAAAHAQAPPLFSDTLLVTATLAETAESEVPASLTVITAEEIHRRQATELHAVLATVPGVSVAQSGSPGHSTSAFLRGTNSNHTLVLWNGVPLNEAFEGRFDFAFLPLEGVDRVEVAPGPFSALYGSALGGVVHVVTRRGSRPGTGNLRLEAGEESYQRGAASWSGALGTEVSAALAGAIRRGDGQYPNDDYDGEDATLRLDGAMAAGAGAWGALGRFNDSEVGTPFDGAVPSPLRRTCWRESQVALPLSWTGSSWSGDGLLSHTRSELAFRDPDSFFAPRSDSEGLTSRGRAVGARSFGDGGGWLAAGGEWAEEVVTYESDYTAAFGPIDEKRRRNDALFAQAHGGGRSWSVQAGVRHDDNEHFGGHTSPRLGGVVRLGAHGRVFASYGEAFRAPSFLELYFPFYGDPDLEPETSRGFELGWAAHAGPLRLSLTAFENRIRNLIEGPPPTFLAVNVGRARTRGGELAVGVTRGAFEGRLAATYLEAEDLATGNQLLRRPQESGSIVLSWRPTRWTLSAVARYVGDRADFDSATFARSTNPSYTRLDLAAAYALWRGVEVSARVENAADERYDDVLGFRAPGRTVIGGVALRF